MRNGMEIGEKRSGNIGEKGNGNRREKEWEYW